MTKLILRWIAVLPAAALGSALAGMAVFLLNLISWPVSTDGLLFKLFIGFARGIAFGISFVYIATYVAPSHKKRIAFVAPALVLALGVTVIWRFWVNGDHWAIYETIVGCVASINCAHYLITSSASET